MALSVLSKGLSILFLTSWTITALGFTALDILNDNRGIIELIGSTSLLTFLICRLIAILQPDESTLAYIITTAHKKSRGVGLATLLFTITWLYELLYKTVFLFIATVIGGTFAAAIYHDAFNENPADTAVEEPVETTALAEIDDFAEKTGVDLLQLIKMIPPRLLVYVVALVWFNFATLGLYTLRLAWRSLRAVFGEPLGAPAGSVGAVDVDKTERQ
ncbi:hypothetical protein BJX99DRAFT_235672 [Aspergillus californicus]